MHVCAPLIYVLLCTCQAGPSYRDHHLPIDTEMLRRQRDPCVDPVTSRYTSGTTANSEAGNWRSVALEKVDEEEKNEEEEEAGLLFHFFFLSLLFPLSFKGDSSTMCLLPAVSLPLCLAAFTSQ